MEAIWIIGGGQVGQYAIEVFQKSFPAAAIFVVEKAAGRTYPENITLLNQDGVDWLARELTPQTPVSKIVPALPLHLAAEWVKKKLAEEKIAVQQEEIPDELLAKLPHPIRISKSQVTASHADFICPSNCREPNEICSYTKQPRPPALYQLLETVTWLDFHPVIIRSRQFAPGLGGFYPEDLWNLYQQVKLRPEAPIFLGTACKCHGIIDCFSHKNMP